MADNVIGSIVIGVSVAIGIGIATSLQSKRNQSLTPQIEALLRERGELTLPALAEAMGMGGFMARGKVTLALGELQTSGRVEIIEAPPGTPQLEKINHIKYRLRATG